MRGGRRWRPVRVPDEGCGGIGGRVGRVEPLAPAVEEEGVGPRREAAAGVLVDGRVGAPRREEGREGEPERERERGSPRRPHRRDSGGRRRRRFGLCWLAACPCFCPLSCRESRRGGGRLGGGWKVRGLALLAVEERRAGGGGWLRLVYQGISIACGVGTVNTIQYAAAANDD